MGRHGSMLNRHTTWWDAPSPGSITSNVHISPATRQNHSRFLVLAPEANPNSLPNIQQLDNAGLGYDYSAPRPLRFHCHDPRRKTQTPRGLLTRPLLGNNSVITTKTLEKILQLAQDGATIIGTKPIDSPSLDHNDQNFKSLIEKLWHDTKPNESRTIGKGRLINTNNPVQALQIKPIIDPVFGIKSIKRRLEDETLIVWLANTQDAYITKKLAFNLPDTSSPQIWNPEKASIMPPTTAIHEDGKLIIPLEFKPLQSLFIVFKNQQPNNIHSKMSQPCGKPEPDRRSPSQRQSTGIGKTMQYKRRNGCRQKPSLTMNSTSCLNAVGGDAKPIRTCHTFLQRKTFEKIAPEHHDFISISAPEPAKTIRPGTTTPPPSNRTTRLRNLQDERQVNKSRNAVNGVPAPINRTMPGQSTPPNLRPQGHHLDKLIDLATT